MATPRPEKKERKSTLGPVMFISAPPANSTWATFRPARSAAWAIDSACGTPAANALVDVEKVFPLMWKVLFVDPWTPGHAPVAMLYQPAPVFGGASVRRPLPAAFVPSRRSARMFGRAPAAA